ncbi:uncharacterized protein [Panulirus ornatus]|uniref:uncharacterized protein isoform X2 n=1 Tax=Panulirus ornatus TaxID=150431 RepID=UPI003A89B14B
MADNQLKTEALEGSPGHQERNLPSACAHTPFVAPAQHHTPPPSPHDTQTHSPHLTHQEIPPGDTSDNTDSSSPPDLPDTDSQDPVIIPDLKGVSSRLDSRIPHHTSYRLKAKFGELRQTGRPGESGLAAPDEMSELLSGCHADDVSVRQGFSTSGEISDADGEFHPTESVPAELRTECHGAVPLELNPHRGRSAVEQGPDATTSLSSPRHSLRKTSHPCAGERRPFTPALTEEGGVLRKREADQSESVQPASNRRHSDSQGPFSPCDPALSPEPVSLTSQQPNPAHLPLKRTKPAVRDEFTGRPLPSRQPEVLFSLARAQLDPAAPAPPGYKVRKSSTREAQIGRDSENVTVGFQDTPGASKNTSNFFPVKRVRKKSYISSVTLAAENPLPEIEDPTSSRSQEESSPDEDKDRRQSFVIVAVSDASDTPLDDSWDHGDLGDDSSLNMKILNDKTQGASKAAKSATLGVCHEPDKHDDVKLSVMNIVEDAAADKDVKCAESGCPRDEKQSERSRIKNVLFHVKEEEKDDVQVKKISNEQKKSVDKCGGQDNMGFVEDEENIKNRENSPPSDDQQQKSSPESQRRRSDPECLSVVKDQIFRCHSYGTELNQVLNNLSADQASPVTTPTLRKRSASRGRPDYTPSDSEGTEKQEETSFSSKYDAKKEMKHPPLRPTFSLGTEDSSPSIFRKLISNPWMTLTRSDSIKSDMATIMRKEEGLCRSTSNIWEGSSRPRGSGSGQHARPPQPPSSTLSRDDYYYILHKHMYRNSRRNVQQKLHRQLSEPRHDDYRWVGVHGGQPDEAPAGGNDPGSPTTPHIVVSTEDETETGQNKQSQPDTSTHRNTQGSNGAVPPNAQSTPAPPPTPANNTEEKRHRPEKLSLPMTTLDLPDGNHPSFDFASFRKTRRNSVNEMLRRYGGSQTNLQQSPLANNIRRSSSRNSLVPSVLDWKQEGVDSLIACVSALYGKLLVVMGMAFPIAEFISDDVPVSFYNGFYLYLYIGSIIFLVYAYIFLLRAINLPTEHLKSKFQSLRSYMAMPDLNMVFSHRNTSHHEGTGRMSSRDSRLSGCSDVDKESDRASVNTMSFKPPKYALTESTNHGSMYLKMGAVLFGIGSMIYSGLEVGQYFELKGDADCADVLLVISPAARMLFTFIQMYFIFLNARIAISRHRVIARFGLMHMIGTNLCIWLNVLVQETKHEIINLTLGHGHGHGHSHHGEDNSTPSDDEELDVTVDDHTFPSLQNDSKHLHNIHDLHDIHEASNYTHNIVRRATSSGHGHAFSIFDCRRSELMGELVDNASPFLFPCTIEYSLLCAGVLYVIWKNINKPEVTYDGDSDISTYVARKARHHYSVDCAHANRGLFMGILVLVLTIISLILFFVLISNEDYKGVAILEANIIELSVYSVATVTVVIGMIQMRELEFIPEGEIELDNILLLIAQTGVYIYTSFSVIGGHFTMRDYMLLPLLSSIITLTQTTLQTIFILDATKRCCYNHDQLERKPGREMVTFLLVCNLAMWAINTFETSRADAHPTQLNFYGIWAWTIISHVSMPLAIFYRFHVTVCLCEIWKRSYKLKNEY